MNAALENLNIRDFTFVLLGNDTEHHETDVDKHIGRIEIGKTDVIQFLKRKSDNNDPYLLEAIKSDMDLAFYEFFTFYTSLELFPGKIISDIAIQTIPYEITIIDKGGKERNICYHDGEIFYSPEDELMDCVNLIEERRKAIGVEPLRTLPFHRFEFVMQCETRDLFRFLQEEHFRNFTLYKTATDYIKSLLSTNQRTIHQAKTPECPTVIPECLVPILKDTKGKRTATIIKAAQELGLLIEKPTFTSLKQIGVKGTPDAYNRYFNQNSKCNQIEDAEIKVAMKHIKRNSES